MNDTSRINVNSEANALLRAVQWLLRPLIRLLIAKGIGFPQIRDLLKSIYVEVAAEDFALDEKRPSDSRVFVLTGVHRKDIKRLRAQSPGSPLDTLHIPTLGGALVSRWLGLPRYLDENGRPRCLPRTSADGSPNLDELIEGVSKDVRPRAILDEWLRLGIVHENSDGQICLDQSAFVPQQGFEEKTFFLGRHLHDHIATCAQNMLNEDLPQLERSVYFSSLTAESIKKLRQTAETEGIKLLQTLNKQALALQQEDESDERAVNRMRFGVYWFQREKDEDGEKKS